MSACAPATHIHVDERITIAMFFVEVLTSPSPLSSEDRSRLAEDLTGALLGLDAAADTTAQARRSMRGAVALTTVVFTEPTDWIVGARRLEPPDDRRYLVRITVPEAWYEEVAAHAIDATFRVLSQHDPEPDRLDREPHAWVHVVGVPEDGVGTLGGPISSTGILRLITSHGAPPQQPTAEAPPGARIDPVCGMVVRLGPDTLTVEHEGVTVAFCASACRRAYADEHGIDLAG